MVQTAQRKKHPGWKNLFDRNSALNCYQSFHSPRVCVNLIAQTSDECLEFDSRSEVAKSICKVDHRLPDERTLHPQAHQVRSELLHAWRSRTAQETWIVATAKPAIGGARQLSCAIDEFVGPATSRYAPQEKNRRLERE